MNFLFFIISLIFFFTAVFKTLNKKRNRKSERSKSFYAYSFLIACYAVFIFIDRFFLNTKFGESGYAISIFLCLLAFQFLWDLKQSKHPNT